MNNDHIQHFEDYVLKNHFECEIKTDAVTIKYDGAPSIFIGKDPKDGKFFVSKKSIFNKNPIVYKSINEILDSDLPEGLKKKFCDSFAELYDSSIEGVFQGDLLFTKGDCFSMDYDQEQFLAFHPNTIVYAVSENNPIVEEVRRANLGVVWHTCYSGKDLETMSRDLNKSPKELKVSPTIFTPKSHNLLNFYYNHYNQRINFDDAYLNMIQTYFNYTLKGGPLSLRDYILVKLNIKLESLKTEKAKVNIQILIDKIPNNLYAVEQNYRYIQRQNSVALNGYNTDLNCFLKTTSGYEKTGHEGIVLTVGNEYLKIVNREQFSKANFSDQYIKGWS